MQDKLVETLEKFKLPIALSLVGLILIIGGVFASSAGKASSQSSSQYPKESLVKAENSISVDVSGSVANPGVYKLKGGARIEDAINSAGGFSDEASTEYVAKVLNLAQKLTDGSKVYVPSKHEQTTNVVSQTASTLGVSTQSKVNLNTSSQGEIEALPGIGPVTATKLISSRPYQAVEDLINKKVVSKAVYEKIKDLVVLY
jgi:competence protein ComEA